eukprot:TRINITY_DN9681_c0_g1_i1.p1 TRINITY_DN9681_c0_g1~~TRINITY_DN9681_c0_g1_i1.p1  ORF type:complete len:546 (+),score=146.76 TRINITY_DN9681_c0_g1_i1:289-1926(+)
MKRSSEQGLERSESQERRLEPADVLILSRWLIPVVPPKVFFEHTALVLRNGLIAEILPNEDARRRYASTARQVIELGADHVLIPGLINMHTHSGMSLLRGLADDCALMDWLMHYMWPAEGKFVGPDFVRDGSALSIAEMIRSGVTCMNDMYFFPGSIAEVADVAGFRAVIGAPIFEFPSNWGTGPDDYIAKAMGVHEKYKHHDRVDIALSPHAPYTVADKAFRKVQQLSAEHNLLVHTHLHETTTEINDHVASMEHNGLRPLARMQQLGLFNNKLIAAHMTQLTDDEIKLCSENGVHVVHCPKSNMKLSSGVCPVAKLSAAGVNTSIGTDGPASNDDQDLLGELRAGSLLDKLFAVDRHPVPTHEWLSMATINAAKALGLDSRIGSLEIGKEADVVAVRLHAQPVYNPITNLCYSATNTVEYVWVQGKALLEKDVLMTMDEATVRSRASNWGPKISEWHLERQRVDLAKVNLTVEELESIAEDADVNSEAVEMHVKSLAALKDAMFHWLFFARTGHSIGASLTELEQAAAQIDKQLARIKHLHSA